MNKAFRSHFKHIGRLPGKTYLFLTPSKTDARVPSQQSAPTTCYLTYWEVSQQTYVQIYCPVWLWGRRVKFSPTLREGGRRVCKGGGGGGAVGGAVADKYHIPATLDNKSPQTPWIGHLPAIIFLPRQYHFIKSPRQQKFG